MLNSINLDGKVYSIKEFKDKNDESYCIMRMKITNSYKGKITDVNLIDCCAYKKTYKYILDNLSKNDCVRVNGKIQKVNTKEFTIKVFKINKIEVV